MCASEVRGWVEVDGVGAGRQVAAASAAQATAAPRSSAAWHCTLPCAYAYVYAALQLSWFRNKSAGATSLRHPTRPAPTLLPSAW